MVRKILDFGAFVDLRRRRRPAARQPVSCGRVNHPSDVLQEGQPIKVRIVKIDPETGKLGLSYRDMLENPGPPLPANTRRRASSAAR